MDQLTFPVLPEEDNLMMQAFLKRKGLSSRMIVKLKRVTGGMMADGRPMRTIDRLRAGQTVCVTLPLDSVRIEGAPMPLRVIYEDEHLLVVNKPPYLAVHPSAGKPEPTLAHAVVAYYDSEGVPRSFRPTNRLDRNTSGLLLAAKTQAAAYALAGQVQKEYRALVTGRLAGRGTIDAPIRVREGSCITREVGPGGKLSITHWEAQHVSDELSDLRVVIDTGRTHQIRVHFAWMGHPLVGDTMYGTADDRLPRHALHCGRMWLTHPFTGDKLELVAPLEEDMQALLSHYGWD